MVKPLNPDFRARVRQSFAQQAMMATLGVQLEGVDHGAVSFSMRHHEPVTQQHGFVHGGAIAAIMDSVCGYSAFSMMAKEAEVLTVEFKVNFVAPALGEKYIFRGTVLKPGRTLMVTEGKAFAVNDGEEKLVAAMMATMMVVTGREDVKVKE